MNNNKETKYIKEDKASIDKQQKDQFITPDGDNYNVVSDNQDAKPSKNWKKKYKSHKSVKKSFGSNYKISQTTADKTKPQKDMTNSGYDYVRSGMYRSYMLPLVKADPYDASTIVGLPYNITNLANPLIDVKYPGLENLTGRNLMEIRHRYDKVNKFMYKYDVAKIHLTMNYLHLAYNNEADNLENNRIVMQVFTEALSKVAAEVFTKIDGLNLSYDTTNPAAMKFGNNHDVNAFIPAALLYQTILQNISSVVTSYNKIMSYENCLLDMTYQHSTSAISELFGYLKKAAFQSKLLAISNFIIGEYYDADWAKQMNILLLGVSRKADAYTDPLLEIIGTHALPNVKINASIGSGVEIINTENYKASLPGHSEEPLPQLVRKLQDKLSITSILKWARQFTEKSISTSPRSYFNEINDLVDAISYSIRSFKTDFSTIRTVFDLLAKTNLTYWHKAYAPIPILRPDQIKPVRNRLIEDLYKSLAGDRFIRFNPQTLRYTYNTIYDKYDGISNFDKYSGGSFIPFSTKKLESTNTMGYKPLNIIPILFKPDDTMEIVNRLGNSYIIDFTGKTKIDNAWQLSKLTPLKLKSDEQITMPTIQAQVGVNDITLSALMDVVEEIFGLGIVKYEKDMDITVPANIAKSGKDSVHKLKVKVEEYIVKNSIMMLSDVEINYPPETMLNYLRLYAPVKVETSTVDRLIGFTTTVASKSNNTNK